MAAARDPSSLLYPTPSSAGLKSQWVGRSVAELACPSALVDIAVVKRNCNAMLATADKLGTGFRAHIKTHKTLEVTRLQIPDDRPLRLVTSTLAEIENLMPFLLGSIESGRLVDILYGVPPTKTAIEGVIGLNRALQGGVPKDTEAARYAPVSLLLDSEQHVALVKQALQRTPLPGPLGVYVKVDSGYQRAGITPSTSTFSAILSGLSDEGHVATQFRGFYTHLGHSYGFSTAEACLDGLLTEIESLSEAVRIAKSHATSAAKSVGGYVLSVGATPTTTAAQNLLCLPEDSPALRKWRAYMQHLQSEKCQLELHAGVYPFLDLQQMATGARPSEQPDGAASLPATLSHENIALRILVEVASVYTERAKPEVLVSAGSMALGREPCKSYSGWGVATPWRPSSPAAEDSVIGKGHYIPNGEQPGWIVGRIAQEHALLTWEGDDGADKHNPTRSFSIGDKLCLWPNHACVAAAAYQCYFVVDTESGDGDVIRDVWVRWRGW